MKAQELKNSILQLAVQGKLVPQDSSEAPASELLKEIKAEKERLIKEGKLKKEKSMPSVSEDEVPFEIPESWQWIRLGDFCSIYNGNSINADEKVEKYSKPCEGRVFIATKDVGFDNLIDYENGIYIPYSEDSFKIAPADSVLLCMEGGSAGRKIGLLEREVCFGNKLCCLSPLQVQCKYLFYFLQTPAFFSVFTGLMTGIIGGVGAAKIKMIHIPIPPLDEQKRIVARIEELLPLVAEYDAAESRLAELNGTFSDKLRKSILQQAIQGKLTGRDPADEPASELLKRIMGEKEWLIKEGKFKKEKPLPSIAEDEIPFEIPENWVWTRLNNLAIGSITYGIIKLGSEDKDGVKVLRCSDVKPGFIDERNIRTVSKSLSDEYSRTILRGGELIINVRGTLGGCAVVPSNFAGYNVAREVAVLPISKSLCAKYFMYLFLSPVFDTYLSENLRGVAYKGLNIELLSSFTIPLPPLAEQEHIVARIDELLALCDRLK